VSSELKTSSWAPSVEEILSGLPNKPLKEMAGASLPQVDSVVPRADRAAARRPRIVLTRSSGLRTRLVIVDVVAAGCAWLVFGTVDMPTTTTSRQWAAAFAALVVTLVAMRLLRLYQSRLCVQRGQEITRIVVAVAAGAVALELIRRDWEHSFAMTIIAAGSCVLAVIALRGMFGQWLRAQRAMGRHVRGLVMIGTNDDAVAVWTMLHTQPELGYVVRGIIGQTEQHPEWEHLRSGQNLNDLPEIARQTDATGVLLVANALSASEVHDAIELGTAQGLHVQIWPGFRGLRTRRIAWHPMSGETFLYVEPERHPTWQLAAKRAVDVLGAAIGLLIVAPILLLSGIAIRLEDGGPALYRQVRTGLNSGPFLLYKLRTMALDADRGVDLAVINQRTDGPLFKAAHDPRVTRVGAIMRALSIDELPQLFNVLTGTMSLVGPRPAIPKEVAQFDPELLRRHSVKPGITGLWQLEARDNPSFHAYRRLDLLYVDNWSICLDLYILLATVPMLIAHTMSISRQKQEPHTERSEAR